MMIIFLLQFPPQSSLRNKKEKILTEAGQYEKENMKSSAKNELWIPAARLHRHRLRPEQHGHQVDTRRWWWWWTLNGGDHSDAKENYYADAKENYYGEDNDDKGRPQKKNYVTIWEIFLTLLSKNSPHITLKSPIKTNQFFSEGVPNADYDVENDDVTNVKLQATAPTRLKGWDKVVNIHIILLYYDKLHQISRAQFFY